MFYLNQTCFFMKMAFTWGVGWVRLLFFHLKNKKRDVCVCVVGKGGGLGKICFVMGY